MYNKIRLTFAVSFLVLGAAMCVTAQENKGDSKPLQIDVGEGEFFNDRSMYEQLTKAGKAMLKQDGLLLSKEILEQLDEIPASIKLKLPETLDESDRQRSFDSTVIVGFLYDCGKCDQKHMGIATGVAISPDGLILTNHHVFSGKANFIHFVMTRDGKIFPVEKVLAAHKGNDIAVIKIAAKDLTYSSIAPSVPQPLDDLYTVSHPEMNFFYASTGKVARYVQRQKGNEKTRWMQIDADFAGGSSGGPAFDSNGNVIGLMTRQVPKVSDKGHLRIMFHECVPVQVIRDFVEGKLESVNSIVSFKEKLKTSTDKEIARLYRSLISDQRNSTNTFYRLRSRARTDKKIDLKKEEENWKSEMSLITKRMRLLTEVQDEAVSLDAFASVLRAEEMESEKLKIVQQILDRHLDSESLPKKLESFNQGMLSPATHKLLERVAGQSKNESSQGVAKFLLATLSRKSGQYYSNKVERASFKKAHPDDIEFYRELVGRSLDDINESLESVVEEYADVDFKKSTLGKLASTELKKIQWHQNLEVGKVAPDIEAPDLDGNVFKLSDYRGKVVLLDFWGDW